jgi:pyruvate,water dikinase
LTILQARPITTARNHADDERNWYLSLRPRDAHLRALSRRVAEELIPQLEAEGHTLAREDLDTLNDSELADSIERRLTTLKAWKKVYWDEFIPFAHGVRRLGTYYNDAVRPSNPYEFVGLMRDQPLIGNQRNQAIQKVASQLAARHQLQELLSHAVGASQGPIDWRTVRAKLHQLPGGKNFVQGFEKLCEDFFDIAFDRYRLQQEPDSLLNNVLELSRQSSDSTPVEATPAVGELEERLLAAVGEDRHEEAHELLEIGRISWKLRDDDNLLLARIESQLLRALEIGVQRLRAGDRISGSGQPDERSAETIARALRDPSSDKVLLQPKDKAKPAPVSTHEKPRQLIGQPASPGLVTGTVRCIRGREDLGRFRRGEVLVCDAIQPTMTHLVPLAAAIVERRGGMLIHGAIIARELGIPCVNGVRSAADVLTNGDFVTVDGYLGIVTLGAPEFDLEFES